MDVSGHAPVAGCTAAEGGLWRAAGAADPGWGKGEVGCVDWLPWLGSWQMTCCQWAGAVDSSMQALLTQQGLAGGKLGYWAG